MLYILTGFWVLCQNTLFYPFQAFLLIYTFFSDFSYENRKKYLKNTVFKLLFIRAPPTATCMHQDSRVRIHSLYIERYIKWPNYFIRGLQIQFGYLVCWAGKHQLDDMILFMKFWSGYKKHPKLVLGSCGCYLGVGW